MDMSMGINFNLNNFTSSYGMQQIPVVRPQDVQAQDLARKQEEQLGVSSVQTPSVAEENYVRASKMANLEDVSLTFNKEDSFDMIGTDVDIAGLDMTKALSDMKRDSLLADYQTFVGPSSDQLMAGLSDGIVFQK